MMVTHSQAAAAVADRVLILSEGKLHAMQATSPHASRQNHE
jgi:putative ABC transport system ATP-binding protein